LQVCRALGRHRTGDRQGSRLKAGLHTAVRVSR
jgi:hypothetical protein